MLKEIPGHVRGFTWILALIGGISAWAFTGNFFTLLGVELIIVGSYLGDQATHLARHHDETPPTWVEKKQQNNKLFFQFLGLVLIVLGIWVTTFK